MSRNKVFNIRYQFSWMKERDGSWFKEVYKHADTKEEACNSFGTQFFPEGTIWTVTESSLESELMSILHEELTADDFTNSVDGINEGLAEEIIRVVRDIKE